MLPEHFPPYHHNLGHRTMPGLFQLIDEMTARLCRQGLFGGHGSMAAGLHRSIRKVSVIFIGAAGVAILMSTQLLFQPFVWRNWDVAEVMQAWLRLVQDRLVVAMTMAIMLATLGQLPGLRPPVARYVLAVFIGACLGEWILSGYGVQGDRQDLVPVLGRVLRWSVVGGAIAAMLHLWRAEAGLVTAAQEAGIEEAHTRRLAANVRIGVLRYQIEPHFLLNTLATIRRLHETDHKRGQHLLGRLLQFMSATLSSTADKPSTLGKEIDLVLAYLDVCASRMQGRLTVRCEVSAELWPREFPALILATLAENAVKHGIFPQEGGTVRIVGRQLPNVIEVGLVDDGVGFTKEAGSGLGLANITERLRLLYGPGAVVQLEANIPRGVRAMVRIPDHPVTF